MKNQSRVCGLTPPRLLLVLVIASRYDAIQIEWGSISVRIRDDII